LGNLIFPILSKYQNGSMKQILFILVTLWSQGILAQNNDTTVTNAIIQKDSLFWVGYNTCNLGMMEKFLVADMEFYHDKGGFISGTAGMRNAMQANICKDPEYKVRRELVPGTFKLFLLKNNDSIYGAVVSGEHYFYSTYKKEKETSNGIARFTHLWLLKDDEWKMHRILSYDHQPAP
jgi:hypothetical protein